MNTNKKSKAKQRKAKKEVENLTTEIDNFLDKVSTETETETVETETETVDVESMTAKEKIAHFKALKIDKANNLKITSKTIGLSQLTRSFKYSTLGEIYKASKLGQFITFLELHILLPLYDIKGLSRDVNTKETKVLRNVKANESNGNNKAIGDLSNIWNMNNDIQNILAQSDEIESCKNENGSYNIDLMKQYSIVPRDIYRNEKIVEVVNEFEFDEVICEFETIELDEVVNIRSLGKNNEVISYKHDNKIRILYGFELMKVYLTTYGETLTSLNEI